MYIIHNTIYYIPSILKIILKLPSVIPIKWICFNYESQLSKPVRVNFRSIT